MTHSEPTAPDMPEQDRLAAEHALRLLEGQELMTARGLMAGDPAFAAAVADWEEKLAPLYDGTPGTAPSPAMWARIEAELARPAPSADIATLEGRVRRWQIASAFSAAAAIVLAFFALPGTQAPPPAPEAPLMANIPIADTPLRLAVTYLPERSEMLVSASGLTADGVHDHELWLVTPDDGAQSLGVVVPGEQKRVTVDAALAQHISEGAQMVLTREPLGGAPADGTAGPVVAEGIFTQT